MKNILKLQNIVNVLDDMGDKFNEDIVYYFIEGINKNIQMIVMCLKLRCVKAQIDIMARMYCDNTYITNYNGAHLFKN